MTTKRNWRGAALAAVLLVVAGGSGETERAESGEHRSPIPERFDVACFDPYDPKTWLGGEPTGDLCAEKKRESGVQTLAYAGRPAGAQGIPRPRGH